MITANELRIGNYAVHMGNVVRITSIECDRVGYAEINESVGTAVSCLIPIHLTPHLLETLGFKQDYLYKYRYLKGSFILHRTCNLKGKEYWCLALDHGQELTTDTKYLHQLQNLYFALTGEELPTAQVSDTTMLPKP